MDGLHLLRERYPWPAERPDLPEDWHGWLCPDTARALVQHLFDNTRLVIELGTWLGVSARAILTNAPLATLVCIDHWKGSPEHHADPIGGDWHRRLATLYDVFLTNLWPWQDRVIPLRADTLAGMQEVAAAGVNPDLVYVDSEHSVERVTAELRFISERWPNAWIIGDDYDNSAVKLAADQHGAQTGRELLPFGAAFGFAPNGWYGAS